MLLDHLKTHNLSDELEFNSVKVTVVVYNEWQWHIQMDLAMFKQTFYIWGWT